MHAHLFRSKKTNLFHPRSRSHGLGLTLSQMEGIIPAIETAHAFAALDVRKFSPEGLSFLTVPDEETKI